MSIESSDGATTETPHKLADISAVPSPAKKKTEPNTPATGASESLDDLILQGAIQRHRQNQRVMNMLMDGLKDAINR